MPATIRSPGRKAATLTRHTRRAVTPVSQSRATTTGVRLHPAPSPHGVTDRSTPWVEPSVGWPLRGRPLRHLQRVISRRARGMPSTRLAADRAWRRRVLAATISAAVQAKLRRVRDPKGTSCASAAAGRTADQPDSPRRPGGPMAAHSKRRTEPTPARRCRTLWRRGANGRHHATGPAQQLDH